MVPEGMLDTPLAARTAVGAGSWPCPRDDSPSATSAPTGATGNQSNPSHYFILPPPALLLQQAPLYRNDMDLVAVRAGCLFTGFSSSDYSGNSVTVRADGGADKWVVFAR